MGKYEPLTHYLEGRPEEIWDARFSEVEQILGFPLPRSAHEYQAWWANQEPGHSQTRAWRDAGWETSRVDLASKRVRFRKYPGEANGLVRQDVPTSSGPSPDLWDKARRLSGIEDRDALMVAALTALVRREAAKQLAALGGTMPDFTVPPRERPTW